MLSTTPIQPLSRKYLSEDFKIENWEVLQPYFEELATRPLDSLSALHRWLQDLSELESVIQEEGSWRQIQLTRNTSDATLRESFEYFITQIEPNIKPYAFKLNQKLLDCPFVDLLDEAQFMPYIRAVRNSVSLFHEDNIALEAKLSLLAQQYGAIVGAMSVEVDGRVYTLQLAGKLLQSPVRAVRERIFKAIADRRLEDAETLDTLFDEMLSLRQQVARNAGFDNYRDYKFRELGRFDYTPADCVAFHESVRQYILPIQEELLQLRKARLQLEALKPWDTEAEPEGFAPLQPYSTTDELIAKSIEVFHSLNPYFAYCLETMRDMGRFDLDSRPAKAPGGYNCPLAESGVPFIFMNAAGTLSDLITMMHEGGHAVHSFLSHNLPLNAFKNYPMEMAELASMSMELFSMDHWDVFFKEESELKRAKLEQLERVISVLPWIATIDKFQHWLYTHPGHTVAERKEVWVNILSEFTPDSVDWSEQEIYRSYYWQKQLHLYEVPFYYIEYGIAQLGAVAMWRGFQQDRDQTLVRCAKALALGYTKPLKQLYATAGISFEFNDAYIRSIGDFLKHQIRALVGVSTH